MKLADKFLSLFKRDVILFFTTLLTGIVIARELGPELMGVWTILLLIPGYAEAFGRFQFDVSAVYFIGKKKADIGKVIFILHMVTMISTFMIFCFYLIGFNWFYQKLFSNIETNFHALALVVFIIYPLRLIYLNYSYLLISQEDIKIYNKTVIIQAVLTSILSIVLIIELDMGINGALIGSIMGLFVAIIYAAIKVQKISVLKVNFDLRLFLEMSKYSIHNYFSGLIGYFQNNVSSLIATGFVGPAQIAFFVLGKSTCEVSTRMVPIAINTALFPHVSRLDDEHESSLLVARLFRVTLLILFLSSLCLSILIHPIVHVLYGAEYYPLIKPFFIMIPGVVLIQSAVVFTTYFSGLGRPDLLTKALIFPLALQIVLSIFLIPMEGALGAAVSFLLSSLSLFLIQITIYLHLSKVGIIQIVPKLNDVSSVCRFLLSKIKLIFDKGPNA